VRSSTISSGWSALPMMKEDPQTQRLLAARKDVFPDYRQEAFEHAFASRFRLVERRRIADSGRVLYQLEAGP
jgi:hypothetical protein